MSRLQNAKNPKKARLAADAAEGKLPVDAQARRGVWRGRGLLALACLASVALLLLSHTPCDQWYLAYIALVPWTLALSRPGKWAMFWAAVAGVVFWYSSVYWLSWVTPEGYIGLATYLSLYWLLAAWLVRLAFGGNMPMSLALPVIWVTLEYARAYVISGFPWFNLAHSQYARTALIQIADSTGQYGVSFLVAAVNGALVDLVLSAWKPAGQKRPQVIRGVLGLSACVVLAGAMVCYGLWRLGENTVTPGPVIGLVQENYALALGQESNSCEEIYRRHALASLDLDAESRQVSGRGMDLVIWPETMLPCGLNDEIMNLDPNTLNLEEIRNLTARLVGARRSQVYCDMVVMEALEGQVSPERLLSLDAAGRMELARKTLGPLFEKVQLLGYRHAFEQHMNVGHKYRNGTRDEPLKYFNGELGKLVGVLKCPILAGAPTLHRNASPVDADDHWLKRNSALWYDPDFRDGGDGFPSKRLYSKVHLVPFSEYVPFRENWLWLHRLLRTCVPEVMDQLDPGRAFTLMELKTPARTYRLGVPICYEGTFDYVCRPMVYQDGKKRVDILANISNDGWFVWAGSNDRPSNEHWQHLSQYCFRAVENRVPVIRAVNTGISASVDSSGRILAVVEQYGRMAAVRGSLLLDGARRGDREYLPGHGARVLVDSRVSLYSRVGDCFAMVVSVCCAAMAAGLIWKRRRGVKGTNDE